MADTYIALPRLGATDVAGLDPVTDGSAAATGKIGEIITASVASPTATGVGATGAFGSVTSISLTAGVWRIDALAGFNENTGVLQQSLSCAISSSATGVGLTDLDITKLPTLISGSDDLTVAAPMQLVNITSTTTYHLNTRFYYTSGAPRHYGRITAVRYR